MPVALPLSPVGTVAVVDVDVLLAAHDELWEQRAFVLRKWWALLRTREQTVARRRRHRLAGEAALVRASGGLSARDREWARRQGVEPVSGARRRARRQVLLTWLHHSRRLEEADREWAPVLANDDVAVQLASAALAEATRGLLRTWGKDAPIATGHTMPQLRAIARGPLTLAVGPEADRSARDLHPRQGDAQPPVSVGKLSTG